MKIIDCHTHIFPTKIALRAAESIGDFYGLGMNFDGTVKSLVEICEQNHVAKCLVCSVATAPEQVRSINSFISESVSQSNGLFFGFATLHPKLSEAELENELSFVVDNGLLGVKLHPDFQKFEVDGKEACKLFERIEGKFPVLVHAGDSRYNYSNPRRIKTVMERFPNLTVIAAHFGGWSEWDEAVSVLCDTPNLYVDTSSSMYTISLEQAYEHIKAYTPARVLFGTDYPMWGAKEEIEHINSMPLSETEKELIFYKNAERLFRL
ncbi:MAG: amidohydrolase family protein [Oscillospiraceae bacterium]|nr:amidohydrolase family protein [Oscillospiraceae bacterium]